VKHIAQVRRVRDLGPAMDEALRIAADGVPGPTFIECAVDLLYDEAMIRQWYAEAAGKGTALGDRALRWYLNRHAARMFAGSAQTSTPPVSKVEPPRAAESAITRTAEAFARAERPLLVIGSQALLLAERADAIAAAVTQLGIPVYLSGMARGLLGPKHPLQMRHARRNALREADCVLLAGVPCDFRLDYGRHVRRSATRAARRRGGAATRVDRAAAGARRDARTGDRHAGRDRR
jgi:acetolactate synthase-1/2/3 large subunit